MDSDDEGDSSVLGRHDHWEEVYTRELINLRQHGDRGEVWFGDAVLQATADFAHQQVSTVQPKSFYSAKVLEVGTGNGTLALELRKRGFQNITGSDYSEKSIELAREVAKQAGEDQISWMTDDILNTQLHPGWDMIVDKGTLDAIGLRSDGESARAQYCSSVGKLLRPGGLLLITSCNSSRDELVSELTCAGHSASTASNGLHDASAASEKGVRSGLAGRDADELESCVEFEYVDHVRTYPVFKFAGQEGSRVCTVAFRKRTQG